MSDIITGHVEWNNIKKTASEMDKNVHRELPGDSKASMDNILIWFIMDFATNPLLSRELEYNEQGNLTQKSVNYLVNLLVNSCVENDYNDERIRALIMSTGAFIDQQPITGPPKWHSKSQLRKHFYATCDKTRGPMKKIIAHLFEHSPRIQDGSARIMTWGKPAFEEAVGSPYALTSGMIPSSAKRLVLHDQWLSHMQRCMTANLLEAEQQRMGETLEKLFKHLLGDESFELSKETLEEFSGAQQRRSLEKVWRRM